METTSEPPFNFKYRVTGAVILLSFPVLLVPWLLGGQNGRQAIDEASLIPEPKSEFISSIGPAVDLSRTSINLDLHISSERADQNPKRKLDLPLRSQRPIKAKMGLVVARRQFLTLTRCLARKLAGWFESVSSPSPTT